MSVFNYFIKDSNWKKKLAIGTSFDFGIMILGIISLTIFQDEALIIQPIYRNIGLLACGISFFISIFYLGYIAINTNLRISKPEQYILANFENPKKMFKIGIKMLLAYCIMPQIYFILGFPLCCLALFIQKLLHVSYISTIVSIFSLFIITSFAVIAIYSSFLSFFYDLRLRSAFNLKRIRKIIIKGTPNVLSAIIRNIFIFTCIGLILLLSGAWTKNITMIPGLCFLAHLTVSEINARCIRRILLPDIIEENKN